MRYGLLLYDGLLSNSVLGKKIALKNWCVLSVPVCGWLYCTRAHCDAGHWHTEEKSHLISYFFSQANWQTAVPWHLCGRNRQAKCSSSCDGSLFACGNFIVVIWLSLKSPSSSDLFSLLLLLLSQTSHGAWMLFLSTHTDFMATVCMLFAGSILFRDSGKIHKVTLSITIHDFYQVVRKNWCVKIVMVTMF